MLSPFFIFINFISAVKHNSPGCPPWLGSAHFDYFGVVVSVQFMLEFNLAALSLPFDYYFNE